MAQKTVQKSVLVKVERAIAATPLHARESRREVWTEAMDSSDDDQPPTTLTDLPDELHVCITSALADGGGVRSICMLSRTDKRWNALALHPSTLQRCAERHGIADHPHVSLALLDVIETCRGLGTNRIFFQAARTSPLGISYGKPKINANLSMPSIDNFALLIRRHPKLTLAVEGHEATQEGSNTTTMEGLVLRSSHGASQQRAQVVRDALIDLENLEKIDKRGNKVWGRFPKARFATRITARGWEDGVVEAAGWTGGHLATCHCELFVSLDGCYEFPERDEGYVLAAEARERSVGWQRHFSSEA